MIPFSEIDNTIKNLEFTTIKTNKKIEYINLPCGFDIETSSVTIQDNKSAFMYIWMLGLSDNTPVYYGRTWEEFIGVCEYLQNILGLSENKRLVVYVHNLGYEFQFMRKYFNWVDVFSISERKPIKALCSFGIEFRDSYILSGYSLANTAKNLVTHKITKLVGDLDYSLIRHHKTELTDTEKKYCENDIAIITAYIQEQIDYYGDVSKIPTTNTGRVRTYVKHECYYTSKSHSKSSRGKYYKYRKIMEDLTIDPEIYPQMKRAFMGGFTHANANYSGMTLENVSSIDFTSSYPAVMVSEKFPMSRFKKCIIETLDQLNEYAETYALIFDVKFKNIRCKISQENYLSESKCFQLEKPIINNGRVVGAELLAITLTNIDWDILKKVYEWDEIAISNCSYALQNYLPKSIIKSILDLYQKKTELKDVEGYEVEYMLSKGMLNSIYGMCVTDIVKDNAIYLDDWGVEPTKLEVEIEKYNSSRNRFLYYPWGLWVTAYARRNLWTGIIAVEDDYIYSDTDSLKVLNYERHKKYVEWFDKQIINKMYDMANYYKFDKDLLSPKTKQGKVKMLGVWDYEGTYEYFKTLGAKRYLTKMGDNLSITVAGLSKQNGIKYMLKESNGYYNEVFKMFNDKLYIPASETGKMTHTYIDEEMNFKITDYKGKECVVNPRTSIHLGACDFTLSISESYYKFINQLRNGYIFNGVKYV